MASLAAIREQRRSAQLEQLRYELCRVLPAHPDGSVWLFGSLARGDWDAYSDVDLLAVAPTQAGAELLADALREARLGDDVLAVSGDRWHQLRCGDDPYWRAIGRDALRLVGP